MNISEFYRKIGFIVIVHWINKRKAMCFYIDTKEIQHRSQSKPKLKFHGQCVPAVFSKSH